ncbi:MAG: hypothetical protein HYX69_20025 [Planctomycetia bacterium]|nr:hypothetical protein [Planctomycetia bacterium]
MKRIFVALAVVAAVLSAWTVWGQKNAEQEPSFWMKKKLEFSEHILSGLVTADFDRISTSATSMNNLGQVEKWTRRGVDSEAYRVQLQIFHYANEELIRQADKKSIDGATLAFSQLTLSCVNCHKVMRDSKR